MSKTLISIALASFGCGDKQAVFPSGTTADTAAPSNTDADGASPASCGDAWEVDDNGIAVEPEACRSWSPRSVQPMNWYSAASTTDAEAGGCGSDCPEEGLSYCDTLAGLGGLNWRLPSEDTLMAAAKRNPDMDDVDGRLWSRDTATTSISSAWTVDLGRAGTSIFLDKSDAGIFVRCISTN